MHKKKRDHKQTYEKQTVWCNQRLSWVLENHRDTDVKPINSEEIPVISARKWADFFSKIYNQEESDSISDDFIEHVNKVLEQHKEGYDLCFCNTVQILDNEITDEDIQKVIKGLKTIKVVDKMEF